MTPRISVVGIRRRSGGSASKMNLLTPTGIGPTRRESSSWSCSDLRKFQCRLEILGLAGLTMLRIRRR